MVTGFARLYSSFQLPIQYSHPSFLLGVTDHRRFYRNDRPTHPKIKTSAVCPVSIVAKPIEMNGYKPHGYIGIEGRQKNEPKLARDKGHVSDSFAVVDIIPIKTHRWTLIISILVSVFLYSEKGQCHQLQV